MILIAIGGNLPAMDWTSPLTICQAAVKRLCNLDGLRFSAASPWYETAPMPPSGQPPYVNGAVCLQGSADPAALLAALQAIEQEFGRQRSTPNAARTLDLDIIAVGPLVRERPDPILPHPRMHERGFVLRPLLDIAPAWRHPLLGLTVRQMWERLPPQDVRRLSASHLRDDAPEPN